MITLEYKDYFILNVYAPNLNPHSSPDRGGIGFRPGSEGRTRQHSSVTLPRRRAGDTNCRLSAAVFGQARMNPVSGGYTSAMDFILWILAVILVISGIVSLFRKQFLWGIVLIVVGLLVGPGGVSIFT